MKGYMENVHEFNYKAAVFNASEKTAKKVLVRL